MVIEQQHLMVQNGDIHDYNKFKFEVPLRKTPLSGDYADTHLILYLHSLSVT